MSTFLIYAFLILSFATCYFYYTASQRSAKDVYYDLIENISEEQNEQKRLLGLRFLSDDLGRIGLFSTYARQKFLLSQKLIVILLVSLAELLVLTSGKFSLSACLMAAIFSWGIGYIIVRYRLKQALENFQKLLNFHLPLVMERLVMAVEAGLDIIQAIQNIVNLEHEAKDKNLSKMLADRVDPVTALLEVVIRLTNAGVPFADALANVASVVDNSSIKHAFIHLSIAQKEGGEVIMPLRELSDATQLQYQENVEEEIAKMPVKATLPLVITFAGLVIFFLTGPIIQIINLTSNAIPR